MKKLTEDQEQKIKNLSDERIELYLEQNKTVLFDIKKVITKGEKIKAELNNLKLANELVKQLIKEKFNEDVDQLRKFFGEYADAIFVSEDDRMFCFQYNIGITDGKQVWVTYSYGSEHWHDYNNFDVIDGKEYQRYKESYDIEVCMQEHDTQDFGTFEQMFNSSDVVERFEIALEDYIIYNKPKE